MGFASDLSPRELARVKLVSEPFCLGCDHNFKQSVITRGFDHELTCPDCGTEMTVDEARNHYPDHVLDDEVERMERIGAL